MALPNPKWVAAGKQVILKGDLKEIEDAILALSGAAWPVGSVYTSITGVNPATELGFGTWERIGEGQVLVGQDATDPDFDTAEETGGSKTAAINHTHGGSLVGGAGFATVAEGAYLPTLLTDTGSGTQSTVQPYCVVYFWKRTA